jgi:hypothetical protein
MAKWLRRTALDQGQRAGMTTSDREQLLELKRENRELKRANEILRKASAFFAQAQLGRPKYLSPLLTSIRAHTRLSRSVSNCRSPRRRITNTNCSNVTHKGARTGQGVMDGSSRKSSESGQSISRSTVPVKSGDSLIESILMLHAVR